MQLLISVALDSPMENDINLVGRRIDHQFNENEQLVTYIVEKWY